MIDEKEKLRRMHRRAQRAEGALARSGQTIEALRRTIELLERQQAATFARMRASNEELRDIFTALATVRYFPQQGKSLHSVMDGPAPGEAIVREDERTVTREGERTGTREGVWAHCFLEGGGIASFRGRDEVVRFIGEAR